MRQKTQYADEELVAAIRAGGREREDAVAWLYRRYVDRMVRFITARSGSEAAARDVFQDAVITLLTAIEEGRFRGQSSLSTYLFAIGKNLWYRRFNRSLRETALNTQAPEVQTPEAAPPPDRQYMASETQALLDELLGSLKAKCRQVLSLWARKYAMKDIAAEMGYANEQVARNKKNQCLNELKERVRQHPSARSLIAELRDAALDLTSGPHP